MMLDKIQKKIPLTEAGVKHLKDLFLIEGRKPNYFISSKLAFSTENQALKSHYIKHRGFDSDYYMDLIIEYIKKFKEANRKDIDSLLKPKLPEILSEGQKRNKINNLLGSLRKDGKIKNIGTTNKPRYVLLELY